MNKFKTIPLLLFLSFVFSANAQFEKQFPQETLRLKYDEGTKVIETDFETQIERLNRLYLTELVKIREKIKLSGDLEALIQVRDEIGRVEENFDRAIPPSSTIAAAVGCG